MAFCSNHICGSQISWSFQCNVQAIHTHSCKMIANCRLPCLCFPACFLSQSPSQNHPVWGAAKPMKALHLRTCYHSTQPSPAQLSTAQPSPSPPRPASALALAAPRQTWLQAHLIKLQIVFGSDLRSSCPGIPVRACHSLELSRPPLWGLSLEAIRVQLIATTVS